MLKRNNDINQILNTKDLVIDEYGNYYEIVRTEFYKDKLKGLTLSQAFYEISYQNIIHDDLVKEYNYKYMGEMIQDVLNGHIRYLKEQERKIFSIQDLNDNNIEVKILDVLKKHPGSK